MTVPRRRRSSAAPAVPIVLSTPVAGADLHLTVDLGPVVDAVVERLEAVIRARLDEALQQPAHSSDSALDVRSAAQRLNLSETAVWRLIRSGELDSLKVGSRRLVPSRAINIFLERR